jgi:hypothetical protein
MILNKFKQVNGKSQTPQINKETIVFIKLMSKMFNFNNMTSYNRTNITSLKKINHAMKGDGKCKPKLGFR